MSEPLPPRLPFSTYFLALSQAPPAFAINRANATQPKRPPASMPPKAIAPKPNPTTAGIATAIIPGSIIFFRAASVAISTHFSESGSADPSINPGISLNCLLISLIISKAASPTAFIVIEDIKNGMQIPMNIPARTIGSVNDSEKASPYFIEICAEYAEIIARAARAAAPIAKPLPIAAVVLPNSSRESVISRTSLPMPAISAMPPALSATGP